MISFPCFFHLLTLSFPCQNHILTMREHKSAHLMYEVVYMDEVTKYNYINMPIPADDAPPEEKKEFVDTYFEKIFKRYKVREIIYFDQNTDIIPSFHF